MKTKAIKHEHPISKIKAISDAQKQTEESLSILKKLIAPRKRSPKKKASMVNKEHIKIVVK